MFYNKKKIKISLLFHGIEFNNYKADLNKELFNDIERIKKLILFLKEKNFKFVFCNENTNHQKVCSITFDDGYIGINEFNNFSKLEQIPYTLFLNSYNIINNVPFIWDLYKHQFKKNFNFLSDNKRIYKEISIETLNFVRSNLIYNPLSLENLYEIDKSSNSRLSLHTHYHQLLMGKFFSKYKEEIDKNKDFLKNFKNTDINSIALPYGLYNNKLINRLSLDFKNIYSIDGGTMKNKIIKNRISLINSDLMPLVDQIEYFLSKKFMIKRYFVNKKYSLISEFINI